MSLSKKAFTSIQRALHNRTFRISLNAIWQEIHDELGIGSVSSKHLLLNPEDHEKLRKWALLEAGADPLTAKISGDRLEVASQVSDEKWATESVFSGMIQVNMRSGEIPMTHGNAVTPPGTLLSVAASEILVEENSTVVLVENGIVARYWHQCRVPAELSKALMVYRGHTGDAETVREWLGSLPVGVMKVGYFDFDPAGLGMAVDYGVDAILIPNPLDDNLIQGINNKPESHLEQLAHRPDLDKKLPESYRRIWNWMTANGRKCAVTQERLMVLTWPLRILYRSGN